MQKRHFGLFFVQPYICACFLVTYLRISSRRKEGRRKSVWAARDYGNIVRCAGVVEQWACKWSAEDRYRRDQNFPAARGTEGAGLTLPFPLVDKRGPALVDNSSMALRMQAQDSALFEFVAFCLRLSSALLFRVLFQLRSPVSPLLGLETILTDVARNPRNLQSPIRRPVFANLFYLFLLSARTHVRCQCIIMSIMMI